MRIRPIARHDIEGLKVLARETGVGFTSLPDNHEFLIAKIERTLAAFEASEKSEDRLYFFVLEDDSDGSIAGCCAIEACVGSDAPFYHYRLGSLAHSSVQLNLHRTLDTLTLCSDHTGNAEVCSLFLREDWRRDRNGALLSKVRWLFMAQFREVFPNKVLAEMRGVFTPEGRSPFWECLGSHFFPMDFDEADRLTGMGQKSFIGELMPKFPIYTPFLSESARAAIGQVHEHTRPAVAMLKKEGLRWEGYVDIFDGGPTVEAYIDDVRAVRDSQLARVELIEGNAPVTDRPSIMASTLSMADFRASWISHAVTQVSEGPDEGESVVCLYRDEAERLGVSAGDSLRVLAG